MAKFQSPLLGYNNNVRHRGRVFHIQTEDSGVNHPHIITHLFMDGGRILKSVKTSYAEHVGADAMSDTVRAMMKEQHKAMFIALRDGQFDELLELPKKASGQQTAVKNAQPAPAAVAPAPAPPPPAAAAVADEDDAGPPTTPDPRPPVPPPTPAAAAVPLIPRPPPEPRIAPAAVVVAAAASRAVTAVPPPDQHRRATSPYGRAPRQEQSSEASLPPELEALLREEPATALPPVPEAPATTRDLPREETVAERRHKSVQELTLDFDSLGQDHTVSPIFQQRDLPPPPKSLFTKEPRTGAYRAGQNEPPAEAVRPTAEEKRRASQPPPATRPSRPPPAPNEPRYAPARPAAIFGAAAKQASLSIFSDELVSDKSLDEVILSYLAEDLDPSRRK
jgi:hypothetical protein